MAPAALAVPPNVPDQLSVNGKDCAEHRYVPTLTPTLRARISDPDPSNIERRSACRFVGWERPPDALVGLGVPSQEEDVHG
jgi:hypothetical protein